MKIHLEQKYIDLLEKRIAVLESASKGPKVVSPATVWRILGEVAVQLLKPVTLM